MPTLTEKIEFKIDGCSFENFNFMNIVLTQELLKPNELRFTMQKKNLFDDESDVSFDVPKNLIGKIVYCTIQTLRFDEEAKVSSEELSFSGIIFNVNVSRGEMVSEILINVVAYSADYALMGAKHCNSYLDEKLDCIAKNTIASELPAMNSVLNFEIEPKFTNSIPYSVQYNESNHEYLVRLAKRYGEWFYYDGRNLVFGKVVKHKTAELYPRTDILNYSYSADLSPLDKLSHIISDYTTNETKIKQSNEIEGNQPASYDGFSEFSEVIKKKSGELFDCHLFRHIQCGIAEDNEVDELTTTLKSQILGVKAQLTTCSGSTVRADLRIGSCFIIKDYIDKPNNKTGNINHEELLICKITHTVDSDGNYQNEFSAVSAKSEYPPYFDSDVHPVSGAQRGYVVDNNDPMKMGRVKVKLEWQDIYEDMTTPWIRISQPHGGKGKGFYFIPEKDETVMVGFEMGNAEKPYVTGTLYNGEALPGNGWPGSGNSYKAIRTRNHTIEIHDGNGGGEILIYDKKKNDEFHYRVTFSAADDLIKLESKGNIELYADKDIILNAKNTIRLKAGEEICDSAGDQKGVIIEAKQNIRMESEKDTLITVKGVRDTTVNGDDKLQVNSNQTVKVEGDQSVEVNALKYKANADTDISARSHKIHVNNNSKIEINPSDIAIKSVATVDLKAGFIKIN